MSEITVYDIGGKTMPVAVELTLTPVEDNNPFGETITREFCLTVEEARLLYQGLLRTINQVEDRLTKYVQVRLGTTYGYTYLDPTGECEVGDEVTVSGAGRRNVGTVIALGRGSYDGPVYEQVTGKVVPLAGQGEEA